MISSERAVNLERSIRTGSGRSKQLAFGRGTPIRNRARSEISIEKHCCRMEIGSIKRNILQAFQPLRLECHGGRCASSLPECFPSLPREFPDGYFDTPLPMMSPTIAPLPDENTMLTLKRASSEHFEKSIGTATLA